MSSQDQTTAPQGKNASYKDTRMTEFAARNSKIQTYPHKFAQTLRIEEFVQKYSHLKDEEVSDNIEHLCGRVMRTAGSSDKLRFYDVYENNVKVQIMASS